MCIRDSRIVALRYLESELPYYRRHPNRSLHFLMMDMDHFKHINDQYGHLEGPLFFIVLYFNGIAMSFREIQSHWHAVSPIS